MINACLNLINVNLASGVKNPIPSGTLDYTKFLDLADLKILTDPVLFVLIIPIL